jgi:hypothetical protein
MTLVDTTKIKIFITEPNLETELRPLLLFKGGLTPGRAKACFNLLRVAMDAELPNATEITRLSKGPDDTAHLCGFHAKSGWQRMGMMGFFSRILQSPSVLGRTKGLEEYVRWVINQTPNAFIFNLDPIAPLNTWSTREWRRPPSVRKQRQPMAEFYPFITTTPTEDHELLLAVDRMVPKGISADIRADVCQDMIVSLLLGETTLDNLRDSTPQFVKRLYKEMPSKYGHLSLDAPLIYGDGKSRTLGETIV